MSALGGKDAYLAARDSTRCREVPRSGETKFLGCQLPWNVALSPRRATGRQRGSHFIILIGMGAGLRGEQETEHGSTERGTRRAESELLLKLELQSDPEALCVVRAAIERAAEVLRFREAETRAIVRSVDEALANVIRHAYGGRTGMPIEVSCWRCKRKSTNQEQQGIEIVLEDEGSVAKPENFKGRSLDEIRPGGLGLHFIRQSMDEVEFSRKKGKNQLRMVKYLSAAPQLAGSKGE